MSACLLRVVETVAVSPRIRRLVLTGPALTEFPPGRDGAHIKLFLPRDGQREPTLPRRTPTGIMWPPREVRPTTRTYSVRRFDAHTLALHVEFVLHDAPGPAADWARRAVPGDVAGIAGPGGPDPMLPPADFVVLAGDLSALPAIAALLENAPRSARGVTLCEVPSPEEIRDMPRPSGIDLRWFVRGGKESPLPSALAALAWPTIGTRHAWLAGEHSAVVSMRDHLRQTFGFDRRTMYAVPYWRAQLDEEAYHQQRHDVMDELEAGA